MSDTWHYNFPWAVEGSVDQAALAEAVDDIPATVDYRPEEPYVIAYDIYLESLPWFAFAKSEILNGRWPHWNPYSFCGAPLYANHLVPITHPPLLIALLSAPVQQIYTVFAATTWWIGGLGWYFFLRRRRLQPIASLAGSALYLTSGHYMPLTPFEMSSVMYVPWLMMASDALDDKPSFRTLSWFAIPFGMMLAAGHPAFVVPVIYFIALYRIVFCITGRNPGSYWLPRLGLLLLALVLGGMLSAIQNYPTWKYMQETSRELTSVKETLPNLASRPTASSSANRSTLDKISDILVPTFSRELELQHKYVGFAALLLALLGLLRINSPPERNGYIALLIIFGLLAFGPLFIRIARFIPGMGISVFVPYVPIQLLGFMLAAHGINALFDTEFKLNLTWTGNFITSSIIAAALFVWLFGFKSLIQIDARWEIEQVTLAWLVLVTGTLAVIAPAIALIAARNRLFWGGFILPLMITVAGLVGHHYQYPIFPKVPVMPVTPSIASLPDTSMYRVIRYSSGPVAHVASLDYPLTFGGNLPMWAGMLDSQGYDSFILDGQYRALKALEEHSIAFNGLAMPLVQANSWTSPLLDAMAVKYIIADYPSQEISWNPDISAEWSIRNHGGLLLYERESAQPRWYLADRAFYRDSIDEALDAIHYVSAFPGGVIIQGSGEDSPSFTPASMDFRPDSISLIEETPQSLEFHVRIPASAERTWFVLSDAFDENWHGYVDGIETEVLRANGAYRAIEVPGGDHTVEFSYFSRDFQISAIISTLTLFILLSGFFVQSAIGFQGLWKD
jgi:hypothetical protein